MKFGFGLPRCSAERRQLPALAAEEEGGVVGGKAGARAGEWLKHLDASLLGGNPHADGTVAG